MDDGWSGRSGRPATYHYTTMSSSRDRVEDTYEAQNDQQLDSLHSKLRTLRGVREFGMSTKAYLN